MKNPIIVCVWVVWKGCVCSSTIRTSITMHFGVHLNTVIVLRFISVCRSNSSSFIFKSLWQVRLCPEWATFFGFPYLTPCPTTRLLMTYCAKGRVPPSPPNTQEKVCQCLTKNEKNEISLKIAVWYFFAWNFRKRAVHKIAHYRFFSKFGSAYPLMVPTTGQAGLGMTKIYVQTLCDS